jgi:hypothetical protein
MHIQKAGGMKRERSRERRLLPLHLYAPHRPRPIPAKAVKAASRKRLGKCAAKRIHQKLRDQSAFAMHSRDRCPMYVCVFVCANANHPTFTGRVSGPAPPTHAEEWLGGDFVSMGDAPACRKAGRRRVLTLREMRLAYRLPQPRPSDMWSQPEMAGCVRSSPQQGAAKEPLLCPSEPIKTPSSARWTPGG